MLQDRKRVLYILCHFFGPSIGRGSAVHVIRGWEGFGDVSSFLPSFHQFKQLFCNFLPIRDSQFVICTTPLVAIKTSCVYISLQMCFALTRGGPAQKCGICQRPSAVHKCDEEGDYSNARYGNHRDADEQLWNGLHLLSRHIKDVATQYSLETGSSISLPARLLAVHSSLRPQCRTRYSLGIERLCSHRNGIEMGR